MINGSTLSNIMGEDPLIDLSICQQDESYDLKPIEEISIGDNFDLGRFKKLVNTAIQLAKVLNTIHKNDIYHLDVKGPNLILNNQTIKLIDFDTSCFPRVDCLDRNQDQKQMIGTPGFTPPEALSKFGEDYDFSLFDKFSFGITILSLLFGGSGEEDSNYPPQLFSYFIEKRTNLSSRMEMLFYQFGYDSEKQKVICEEYIKYFNDLNPYVNKLSQYHPYVDYFYKQILEFIRYDTSERKKASWESFINSPNDFKIPISGELDIRYQYALSKPIERLENKSFYLPIAIYQSMVTDNESIVLTKDFFSPNEKINMDIKFVASYPKETAGGSRKIKRTHKKRKVKTQKSNTKIKKRKHS